VERFYREARALSAFHHPNTVSAYDITLEDSLYILVMEFVDGVNLEELVRRSGPLNLMRACHYIHQAALGLQHAHEYGVVHQDLKPADLLIDRRSVLKVIDWGLARFLPEDHEHGYELPEVFVLGNADYAAPEQSLKGNRVDARADIYHLGGIFYYCLTGQPPFPDGTAAQKLIWHQGRQPEPVRSLRPDVPAEVVAVLEGMMAKDVASRFQTSQLVADALAPWTQAPIPPPTDEELPSLCPAIRALDGF
jgi:serine/threonine protein kinase